MRDRYDVAIVGSRCAGAALAVYRARDGIRVAAFDRDPIPSDCVLSTPSASGPIGRLPSSICSARLIYTSALHMVERYRLIDYEAARRAQQRAEKELFHVPEAAPDPSYRGKGLQLNFTVEHPGAFTTPWSATITYRRTLIQDWLEVVCAENKHEYYAVRDTAVPSADNPDF